MILKKFIVSVKDNYHKLHWYIKLVLDFSLLLSAGLAAASCVIYMLSDVYGDYFYNIQYSKETFSCALTVLTGGLAAVIIGDIAEKRGSG